MIVINVSKLEVKMEEVISLQEIILILRKRILLILSMTILGVIVLAGFTFFLVTPKYGTDVQLVVQSNQENATGNNLQSDLTGNVMMVNTYKDLIKSDIVLDQVASELAMEKGGQYTLSELDQMINVTQSQNSQMFSINVVSRSAKEAMDIANKTAMIFKEKAVEILKVDKVSIISLAKLKEKPVSPNKQLNLIIGAAIGFIMGALLTFLIEFLDKTVKDEKFISNELALPLLGEISIVPNKELQSSFILNSVIRQSSDLYDEIDTEYLNTRNWNDFVDFEDALTSEKRDSQIQNDEQYILEIEQRRRSRSRL